MNTRNRFSDEIRAKFQLSSTYGKKKARITACACATCKTFETVGWRVHFPDGLSLGFNTWQQALNEALRFWAMQK